MRSAPAYSLLETVVAASAAGVLVTAMGSALTLTASTLPSTDEPAIRTAQAEAALARIVADAANAENVTIEGGGSGVYLFLNQLDAGVPQQARYHHVSNASTSRLFRSTSLQDVVILEDLADATFELREPAGHRPTLRITLALDGKPDVTLSTTVELLARGH